MAQSVDSLSPFLATRLSSTSINRLMYEYLTDYDPGDNHAVPGLATEWKPSADKLTWTYTIRSGAKWSDGKSITAKDAAWTFNKMMTDEAAATANGSFVANFRKVTAPSDTELVVELKKPQATMTALDVPIVPEHVWSKVKDLSKFNNDKTFPVVGNGPYVLTGYKPDSYVRMEANKTFWRGAPKFDELVFKYYKDGDAAVAALRKGEVSFVSGLTPAQADSLAHQPDIKVNDAPGRRFYALAVNPGARAKDGTRMGDGDPSLRDPGCGRPCSGRSTARRSSTRSSRGTRSTARATSRRASPPTSGNPPPSRSAATTPRPPPGSSTRPATRRTARGDAPARTASRSTTGCCATPPTPTTRPSGSTSRNGGASSASA